MTYIVTVTPSQIEIFRGTRRDAAHVAMAAMSNGEENVAIRREILPSRFPYTRAGQVRIY